MNISTRRIDTRYAITGPVRPQIKIAKNGILAAILFIAFYYVSYRYPFEIGDGVLSATYSATPMWLQIMKFAVLASLIPFGWITLRNDRHFTVLEQIITVFSILACIACAGIALIDFSMATRLFEIGFIMFFAVLFANPAKFAVQAETFVKMLKIFFWINLLAYVIQFALFWFFDRMPSMAFGGATTRFGGIWDDPNSALAPFALYVPYWLTKNKLGWHSAFLIAISLISIVLAQSITSLFAIIIAIPALILFFRKQWSAKTQTRVFFGALGAVALIITVGVLTYLSGALDVGAIMAELDDTLGMKLDSASQRSGSYSFLDETSILTVLGIAPLLAAGENQFVNVFANFGLLMLAIFVTIHVLVLHCLYVWTRLANTRSSYALAVGCSCYFIWYFVSMINIPKAEVFPVNLLAAFVAGMAIAAKKGLSGAKASTRQVRAAALSPNLTQAP